MVRASVYQLKGRGFESRQWHLFIRDLFTKIDMTMRGQECKLITQPRFSVGRSMEDSSSMEWTDGCPLQLGNSSSSIVFPQLWKRWYDLALAASHTPRMKILDAFSSGRKKNMFYNLYCQSFAVKNT